VAVAVLALAAVSGGGCAAEPIEVATGTTPVPEGAASASIDAPPESLSPAASVAKTPPAATAVAGARTASASIGERPGVSAVGEQRGKTPAGASGVSSPEPEGGSMGISMTLTIGGD
jgi:hypothetical protein